jgi:DNA adenine methylase
MNKSIIDKREKNVSPLRYPGGKTRACKILDEIINQYFNINSYSILISPFFGGGSFEFYFQNKYHYKLIVNDKFTPLYNFWKQIKHNKDELYEKLIKIKSVSKEDFTNYRSNIFEFNNDMLQQAFQYFVINRCSFSGATLSGGFSEEASKKRFTLSSINKIHNLDLSFCDGITDITELSSLTQFQTLDLSQCIKSNKCHLRNLSYFEMVYQKHKTVL